MIYYNVKNSLNSLRASDKLRLVTYMLLELEQVTNSILLRWDRDKHLLRSQRSRKGRTKFVVNLWKT